MGIKENKDSSYSKGTKPLCGNNVCYGSGEMDRGQSVYSLSHDVAWKYCVP